MYGPNFPETMSLARKIGSSVPSAVVVSANETGTNACTKPVAASTPTTPVDNASATIQPMTASLPGRQRNSTGSSS